MGACDEDITPSDAPVDPLTIMQGPTTRVRMRQLNLEVSSFLSDPFHSFENRLLPNNVVLLRNSGEAHEVLGERCGGVARMSHTNLRPSLTRRIIERSQRPEFVRLLHHRI
jgi:hypothetical protein